MLLSLKLIKVKVISAKTKMTFILEQERISALTSIKLDSVSIVVFFTIL